MTDTLPSPGTLDQIPLELQPYRTLQKLIPSLQQQVRDYTAARMASEMQDVADERLEYWQQTISPMFEGIVPLNIAGSDSARILRIHAPSVSREGEQDPFYWIDCDFYEDGSPYSPEEFIDRMPPHELNRNFRIYLGAEFKPFLALANEVDNVPPTKENPVRTPKAYLAYLQKNGLEPKFLSPQDCQNLNAVLPLLRLDVHATMVNDQNDLLQS